MYLASYSEFPWIQSIIWTAMEHARQPFVIRFVMKAWLWKNVIGHYLSPDVTQSPCFKSPQAMLVQYESRMILAWSLHFASCILILLYGSHANQGRRWVNVDREEEYYRRLFRHSFSLVGSLFAENTFQSTLPKLMKDATRHS